MKGGSLHLDTNKYVQFCRTTTIRTRAHARPHARTHLCPEPVLELLLGGAERLDVVELVQVGEHAHYLGKPVHLQHVQELERLHLETKAVREESNGGRRGSSRKTGGGGGRREYFAPNKPGL